MTCFAIHQYMSNAATKYAMSHIPRELECQFESKNKAVELLTIISLSANVV
jgi:hypothetical protein